MSSSTLDKCGHRSLHRVFCMQGGADHQSYAMNSEAPASAIKMCKPMLLKAIHCIDLHKLCNNGGDDHQPFSITVADLGCATGYNTLATVDMVVESLTRRCKEELGFEPEFEAFFSDLPSNDFNSLFRDLLAPVSGGRRRFFAAGVPGSFYHRLFPRGKLHVAVSLSALHWLSQVPESVQDSSSPAWNAGRAWVDGAKAEVVEAYAKQSEDDLGNFLRFRQEEIVKGGVLFMLMGGRPDLQGPEEQLDEPKLRDEHPFVTPMDQAWQDLIDDGLIDESTRDRFNIPAYMRNMSEVEKAVRKCGGFDLQRLEYKQISEHSTDQQLEEWVRDMGLYGRAKANLVRATLRPIVEAHIGPSLSEELFDRFERRVSSNSDGPLLRKRLFYGVIVVCAIRK